MLNAVVPPVTNSTRKLLLRKLEELESSQKDSSKKNELSLLNVSNWNNSGSEDEDQNAYLLSGTHVSFAWSSLFHQFHSFNNMYFNSYVKLFYRH